MWVGAVSAGAAEALSVFRVLAALPLAWAVVAGVWATAAGIFAAAVATDLLDGPLARRRGDPRPSGALLDHGADALFVTAGLGAFSWHGAVSPLLPLLVALAFVQYAWDSGAHRGAPLRGHAIGRINGIAYYVLVGAQITATGWWPSAAPALEILSLGLIATTAFSMSQRARAAKRPAQ